MPVARKVFHSTFVVEKSKLTRLIEVIETRIKQVDNQPRVHYAVRMQPDDGRARRGKEIECESLQQVLSLDNAKKSRIVALQVIYRTTTSPRSSTSVDFDGADPSVTISVTGQDDLWVNETFSAAEEQVERTLGSSLAGRLSRTTFPFVTAMALSLLMALTGAFFIKGST